MQNPVDLNLIEVYAPTTITTEDHFMSDEKQRNNIIMGDFNVGRVQEGKIVRNQDLGLKNERGDRSCAVLPRQKTEGKAFGPDEVQTTTAKRGLVSYEPFIKTLPKGHQRAHIP